MGLPFALEGDTISIPQGCKKTCPVFWRKTPSLPSKAVCYTTLKSWSRTKQQHKNPWGIASQQKTPPAYDLPSYTVQMAELLGLEPGPTSQYCPALGSTKNLQPSNVTWLINWDNTQMCQICFFQNQSYGAFFLEVEV